MKPYKTKNPYRHLNHCRCPMLACTTSIQYVMRMMLVTSLAAVHASTMCGINKFEVNIYSNMLQDVSLCQNIFQPILN